MRVDRDLRVSEADIEEFQEIIGFHFHDRTYLIQALLHGSLFSGDREKLCTFRQANNLVDKDYEKLEYLGDAVLGLIIAEYAYNDPEINRYARENKLTIEGVSTKIRTSLASNEGLKPVAKKIKLSRFVLADENVNINGKLSDIIEALIGAIYVDGGKGACYRESTNNYSIAKDFVYRFFDIETALEKIPVLDPKGKIQQLFQQNGWGKPCYRLIDHDGPDHEKQFTIGLYMNEKLLACATAKRKREAEKAAAALHLKHISGKEI